MIKMDIISFSMNYWEDPWQSRHYIMSYLSRKHNVLFISPPIHVLNLFNKIIKRDLPETGLTRKENGLTTYVPPNYLPRINSPRICALLTEKMRTALLKKIINKLNFKNVVLFLWHPRFYDMIGRFDEVLTCYYLDEEFASYYTMSENTKNRIRKQEETIINKSDIVFVNGFALLREKKLQKAVNIPMGVDYSLFSRASATDTEIPADLKTISTPRIGYIGFINDKVDFNLLIHIARAKPYWSIVLIGPVHISSPEFKKGFDALKKLPNIHLLGQKPREYLPNYIKGLDVCLMCYRLDGWAFWGYPLKLHEYLAGGKPVVSADLPNVQEFSDVVHIARENGEWIAAINKSLTENDGKIVRERTRVASENTWENRVQVIENNLQQIFESKFK